jgi:S-DNA-T family DNA segregation ATPase FtsK/SpoIIIE
MKKKTRSKKVKKKGPGKISRFLHDERLRLALGVFFILLALYLLLALISYLFTWKTDQSFEYSGILSNPDIKVENWASKTGAWSGNLLIYKWFGLASFIIPVLFILLGLKVLKIKVVSTGKILAKGLIG